jgi:hypothetical protein
MSERNANYGEDFAYISGAEEAAFPGKSLKRCG